MHIFITRSLRKILLNTNLPGQTINQYACFVKNARQNKQEKPDFGDGLF